MSKQTMMDPITKEPLPVVTQDGKVKAVLIEIERFEEIVRRLEMISIQDLEEAEILSRSLTFHRLVDQAMQEIKDDKGRPWRQAHEEIRRHRDADL
ncbi:MAG: hypothetical protein QME81_20285 [bacterium]|nr:hypothetical protein [bacterium]